MSPAQEFAPASNLEEGRKILYPGDIRVVDEQDHSVPIYYALIPRGMLDRGYMEGGTVQRARALIREATQINHERVSECEGKTLKEAHQMLSAIFGEDFNLIEDESPFEGVDKSAGSRFQRWLKILDELIEVCAG